MKEQDRVNTFKSYMGDIITKEKTQQLINWGFFTAPASRKYHGNYEGGLFDHSLVVAQYLVELTEKNNLKWERHASPRLVGMFHDLCKMDQYRNPVAAENILGEKFYDTDSWEYNDDTLLKGHGDKSVMLLSTLMELTMEEVMCIRYHMGAFTDKEEWKNYTKAVARYPNVLWTHHADMLSAHVDLM